MPVEIRYTLLPDGSSDRALIPILTWLLRRRFPDCAIQAEVADLRGLRNPPKTLPDRIKVSLELYPCDLLFVHRDAERVSLSQRLNEIERAIEQSRQNVTLPESVRVVPVRMQEAWLLIDETALRKAAGNPNGRQPLQIPSVSRLEGLPDPKEILYELLRRASGLEGRKLKKFEAGKSASRVTNYIDDFSPLQTLTAFSALQNEIAALDL